MLLVIDVRDTLPIDCVLGVVKVGSPRWGLLSWELRDDL